MVRGKRDNERRSSYRKWVAAIAVVALLVPLLAGCGGRETTGGTEERDELVVALGGERAEGYDPTTGWGRYGSPLFQSTLLTRDDDLNIVNDLATAYEVSEDGLTYTVSIRKDVKFSDGEPLTAEDVVYTFETAAKSGSVVDLTVLEKVQALDDYTVSFTLKQPMSTFVNLLATLGIVPKHAHGEDYAYNPIGSGPYKLVQWDRGQQMIVEANPYYYGKKPYFKRITFLFLQEDAAFAAAQAGEVDIAAVPHTLAGNRVPGMRLLNVRSVDNRGICFPFVPSGSTDEEGNPVGNDVTSDVAIRKAINVAVDRRALVEGVLKGYGTPAYTICDGLPWWNPETVIEDADPEKAKRILEEGGWKDVDGDGIVEKGGLKASFTLVYPSSDQTRQSLAMAVADMIRPIGIDIKVEGKSWDDIKRLMHSNAVLFGWGSHTPMEMYNVYHGKNRGREWYNANFYHNPKVDVYMDQALAASGEEESLDYWKKAQWDGETGLSARGDAPWAWLVNIDHCYFVNERLDTGKNRIEPHGHGWPITANIVDWKWKD
ncbi:ABC transporter substrate-binding protein [Candidatus Solincola sp.]|nr:ABC transporter substrate-binding protein [Actinomycetota bacterium]MDI7252541.1 ABC transporter substrate-binding protein [Actinomycetota bacterium]